uniref:Uncharacterized protein n=1 Tax=Helianthus annuus TaxID=4232 RepID=A0A251RS60_HELAN
MILPLFYVCVSKDCRVCDVNARKSSCKYKVYDLIASHLNEDDLCTNFMNLCVDLLNRV